MGTLQAMEGDPLPEPPPRPSGLARWSTQLGALTKKNFIILSRSWQSSLMILLLPAVFVACLRLFSLVQNSAIATTPMALERCGMFESDERRYQGTERSCVTLMYAPSTPAWDSVMRQLATQAGWTYGVDVVGVVTEEELAYQFAAFPGMAETGILFVSPDPALDQSYELWLNQTQLNLYDNEGKYRMRNTDLGYFLPALQTAVDSAIAGHLAGGNIQINLEALPELLAPSSDTPISGNELVTTFGPMIILLAASSVAVVVMYFIVYDKRNKLLGSMRMMGLMESAFWLSFVLCFLPVFIVSASVATAMGNIMQIQLFLGCNPLVHILTLAVCLLSVMGPAIFAAALVTKPRPVQLAALVLLGLSMIAIMPTNAQLLYNPSNSAMETVLFLLLPWMHYAKCLNDIASIAIPSNPNPALSAYFTMADFYKHVRLTHEGDPCSDVTDPTCWLAPSTSDSCFYMLASALIYYFLGWYVAQIWVGDNGSSKPVYFFLLPTYWGCASGQQEALAEDTLAVKQQQSRLDQSVVLHKLSKQFKNSSAVTELSLTMKQGEIFAMLGHNGAGKSTTLSMMSGLIDPTHGEGFIFGHSITNEAASIQSFMGICPQDNLLWEALTAAEHLALYAAFKGVPWSDSKRVVAAALESFRLTNVEGPAGSFSGGMKRRLLIAMAVVGYPKIVVLDEPTTGMDPLNRRQTWESIQALKKDMLVVLTTHSMEEADALGDNIAILSGGRLRACGAPLFLKQRFGAGYQVSVLSDADQEHNLEQMVRSIIPNCETIAKAAGSLTIGVPAKCKRDIAKLFHWLEDEDRAGPTVKEWGISDSTLEEVFLRLAAQDKEVNALAIDFSENEDKLCVLCGVAPAVNVTLYTAPNKNASAVATEGVLCLACAVQGHNEAGQEKEQEEEEGALSVYEESEINVVAQDDAPAASGGGAVARGKTVAETTEDEDDDEHLPEVDLSHVKPVGVLLQTRAIILNNGALLLAQRKSNCCQITFVVLAVLLNIFVFAPVMLTPRTLCPGGWILDGASCVDAINYRKAQILNTPAQSLQNYLCLNWTEQGYCNEFEWMVDWYGACNGPNCQRERELDESRVRVWYQDSPTGDSLSSLDMFGHGQGEMELATIASFYPRADTSASVLASQNELKAKQVSTAECQWPDTSTSYRVDGTGLNMTAAYNAHFPDAAIRVGRLDATRAIFHYNLQLFLQLDYTWNSYYYVSMFSVDDMQCEFGTVDTYSSARKVQRLVAGINSGVLRAATGNSTAQSNPATKNILDVNFNPPPFGIEAVIGPFLFSAVVTMMQLPQLASHLAEERSDGLLHLMRTSGLRTFPYWLGNYLTQSVLLLTFAGVWVVFGYISGSEFFTRASPMQWIVLFLLWTHGQMGMAVLISGLFNSTRVVSAICALVVLGSIIITLIALTGDVFMDGFLVVPSLAYARALSILLKEGGTDLFPAAGSSLAKAWWYLFGFGSLYLVVGIALHTFRQLPSLMAFVEHVGQCWAGCCRSRKSASANALHEPLLLAAQSVNDEVGPMDSDVMTQGATGEGAVVGGVVLDPDVSGVLGEAKRALRLLPSQVAVRLTNLRKVFTGKRSVVAVQDVSLALKYGEVFGLLGPNGAGKSTTLTILSGLMQATGGTAHVGGFQVPQQADRLYRVLGICPQFDRVWKDLTVRQHFAVICRLKGIHGREERGQIQRIAEKVGLDGDPFNKKASELSGGMRRRLTIGMSLIGDPKVWLCDEPSTGLDPETRRQIWDIVNQHKRPDNCIVITTHSMEEADTLCTRIGIVAKGRMRCIGTQLRLKNQFGDGYHLTLGLDNKLDLRDGSKALVALDGFVMQLCRSMRLVSQIATTRAYTLPKAGIQVSRLFEMLEGHKVEYGIREWGLTQTSLDEVFVKIVKEAEKEEGTTEPSLSA